MESLGTSYLIPYPEKGTYKTLREKLARDLETAGFTHELDSATLIGKIFQDGNPVGEINETNVVSKNPRLDELLRRYEF